MNVQQKKFQNRSIRYLELPKRDLLLNTKDVLAVLHITDVKGRVGFPGVWSATCPRPFSPTCWVCTPPFLQ